MISTIFSAPEVAARLVNYRGGKTPLNRVGSAFLGRPFSRRTGTRVFLVFNNHPLAWSQYNGFLRYARRFRDHGIEFRAVEFGQAPSPALLTHATAIFVQAPYAIEHAALTRALTSLREAKPEAPICFFDWAAPTDIRFSAAVADADAYIKKSIFSDRERYGRPTEGHTELGDYFARRHGVENPPIDWTVDTAIVPRLHVGPSFACDRQLAPLFENSERPPAGPRPIDLHARLAINGTPWYSAMRAEAKARVDDLFTDLTVASKGRVAKKAFMEELRQSRLCFSPFGYGEVCWRDFEAIAAGAVLIKPDMSHLEAFPDIYRPNVTYLPVRWDLSDLDTIVRAALADPAGARRIAENAFEVVRRHLLGPDVIRFVETLVEGRASRSSPP